MCVCGGGGGGTYCSVITTAEIQSTFNTTNTNERLVRLLNTRTPNYIYIYGTGSEKMSYLYIYIKL